MSLTKGYEGLKREAKLLLYTNDYLKFTEYAWEKFYDSVDSSTFPENDTSVIYESLSENLDAMPFCVYLKRFLHERMGLDGDYMETPVEVYQKYLCDEFEKRGVPASFDSKTARMSSTARNWLNQQTVKRSVVFLLAFGLGMGTDDVNDFLEKALHERYINPKEPLETISWYCFEHDMDYQGFQYLWGKYLELPSRTFTELDQILESRTSAVRSRLFQVQTEEDLMYFLSVLKSHNQESKMSVSARINFNDLYNKSRLLVANLKNQMEEERFPREMKEYRETLSRDPRLTDEEKFARMESRRLTMHYYTPKDVTEGDLEKVICSAVPTDKHGNLIPAKASSLNKAFYGKRFTRQHIHDILYNKIDVDRFDLITLNFFIYSQSGDSYSRNLNRFNGFIESTNWILAECSMGDLYVTNPYESFVLMCMLADDPLGTYADVLELSYHDGKEQEYEIK